LSAWFESNYFCDEAEALWGGEVKGLKGQKAQIPLFLILISFPKELLWLVRKPITGDVTQCGLLSAPHQEPQYSPRGFLQTFFPPLPHAPTPMNARLQII